MADETYLNSIRSWRHDYTQRMLSPDGWFAISGLFWLSPGPNTIGSETACQVVLPQGAAPGQLGTITLQDSKLYLECLPGIQVTINDQPVTRAQIIINDYGSSDWIVVNELKLSVIQRGMRLGVRVYDKNNPSLAQFLSLRWYPINPDYCIEARFFAAEQEEKLMIVNVLGDTLEMQSPGYVEFSLQGGIQRMYAVPVEESDRLWFMFQDATSKDSTYPGGRFMTSEAPRDGVVTLDFNKAHNPPCAYTDFATCPLPPAINRLNVAIKAGELKYPRASSLGAHAS